MSSLSQDQQDRLDRAFDGLIDICLDIVQNREPAIDRDGHAVTDDDGRPLFAPVSASKLKVVLQLCQQLGIGKVAPAGSSGDTLRREAEGRGWKVDGRPVDVEAVPEIGDVPGSGA